MSLSSHIRLKTVTSSQEFLSLSKKKVSLRYSFLMLVFSLMCFLQMLVYYDKLH